MSPLSLSPCRAAVRQRLDDAVRERLDMEAMKLRAAFAAEFPTHRGAVAQLVARSGEDVRRQLAAAAEREAGAQVRCCNLCPAGKIPCVHV